MEPMEAAEARRLVGQLSEDLSWLEDHCRQQPAMARQSGQLRLAAAAVRNVLGPYLDEQEPRPLHIVVVGGAGTGKSTVVNFLTGSASAEANPQAGFTRHPVAYVTSNHQLNWTSHLGFLGTLQRLPQPGPSNLDQDVYQVRRVIAAKDEFGALGDCVIWDCPDMTTWAATGYVPRLIEVAGLADVIVYVASDERYNDEVPTQFLQLLVQAGKPVVVCLTKMNESHAGPLVSHFQWEVLSKMPKSDKGPPVPVLAIPFLTPDQLKDPIKNAAKYRIPLLNQIGVLTDPIADSRLRTVNQSLRFLSSASESLLDVARQDLAALDAWRVAVQTGQVEFDNRYRREYLNSEGFRRFDDARDKLMELMELPGAGKVVAGLFWVLRFPYRLLRNAMGKALARPETVNLPEHSVLDSALRAWLDSLRAEAIRKAESHALWRHLANGFNSGLGDIMIDRFEENDRRFQLGSADEIETNSSAITIGLIQNPSALGSLRIFKLLLDLFAIGLALWVGNFGWMSIIWAMLFVSIEHQIVELIVRQIVEQKREQTRARKQLMVNQYISAPMADWLTQWPSTGGSTYEKLNMALRRVPATIRQLAEVIVEKQQRPATPEVPVEKGPST